MHRGRTWTQRQLIGLGTPQDYNTRLRDMIAQGATAVSLIPCNSVFRGYDMDESHIELLGTCGTVVNTADHMDAALAGVDLAKTSCAHERPFAVHAARLHARDGEAPRCRLAQHHRHLEPVGLHQPLRRQPHVLPHRARGRAEDPGGPHRLLQQVRAEVESAFGGRPAHAAGRRDARRGNGLHARLGRAVRRRLRRRAAWTPTSSCRASRTSSTSR